MKNKTLLEMMQDGNHSELILFPLGQWNTPSMLPTHDETETVECVVIVKGAQLGMIHVEKAFYIHGQWNFASPPWELIAWALPVNFTIVLK